MGIGRREEQTTKSLKNCRNSMHQHQHPNQMGTELGNDTPNRILRLDASRISQSTPCRRALCHYTSTVLCSKNVKSDALTKTRFAFCSILPAMSGWFNCKGSNKSHDASNMCRNLLVESQKNTTKKQDLLKPILQNMWQCAFDPFYI